jgi:hypothetical protein
VSAVDILVLRGSSRELSDHLYMCVVAAVGYGHIYIWYRVVHMVFFIILRTKYRSSLSYCLCTTHAYLKFVLTFFLMYRACFAYLNLLNAKSSATIDDIPDGAT